MAGILAMLWGLTVLGLFLVVWPLAYLNYWLLSRHAVARQLTTA